MDRLRSEVSTWRLVKSDLAIAWQKTGLPYRDDLRHVCQRFQRYLSTTVMIYL